MLAFSVRWVVSRRWGPSVGWATSWGWRPGWHKTRGQRRRWWRAAWTARSAMRRSSAPPSTASTSTSATCALIRSLSDLFYIFGTLQIKMCSQIDNKRITRIAFDREKPWNFKFGISYCCLLPTWFLGFCPLLLRTTTSSSWLLHPRYVCVEFVRAIGKLNLK